MTEPNPIIGPFTEVETCAHPIFIYLGAGHRGPDGLREQRHRCVDCGHEERDVSEGSVMVGHAPGECSVCDKYAETIPSEQKARWIEMNAQQRGETQ